MPALATLITEFSVSLNAKLLPPDGESKHLQRFDKDQSLQITLPRECPLRIVISGLSSEGNAIGDVLSNAGLHFQHPSVDDFDARLQKYVNPHWLLRPGAEMPRLTETGVLAEPQAAEALDEMKRSRVMRLFDSANDGQIQLRLEPSPRLRTVLAEYVIPHPHYSTVSYIGSHQLSALARMVETEQGVIAGARFPSLWEVSRSPGGSALLPLKYYQVP